MNSIPSEQNTERQLQRLAAQRQLYATAKTVFGWQITISGPIPVLFATAALIYPQLKPFAALWGIIVVLSDVLWLTPWTKRLRIKAAQVQELFDCDVLGLPWDELKSGKPPDPELIKEQSDKYKTWAHKMPPLSNWYDLEVGQLPLHVGRIACQRANCWWDANQRRRYANTVIAAVGSIFVIILFLSLEEGFTISDFILKVAAPLAPAMLLGIRQYTEQTEAASRLDTLKAHAERLWNDALGGQDPSETSSKSRSLQSEIFDNRKRSPLIFDAIFKRLRNDYESQMNHGTAELVAEARARLNSPTSP
jgi:hypothetical protein